MRCPALFQGLHHQAKSCGIQWPSFSYQIVFSVLHILVMTQCKRFEYMTIYIRLYMTIYCMLSLVGFYAMATAGEIRAIYTIENNAE